MSEKCSHKNLYVNVYSSPVHNCHNLGTIWASQVALVVKNPPANSGDVKDRGHKRSLGCVRKFPWRRAWQPTPLFLPGESHGQRSLPGYGPYDQKESDTI